MPKPQPNVPNTVPLAVWPCADTNLYDRHPHARRDVVNAEIAWRVAETYTTADALIAAPLGSVAAAVMIAGTGRRVVALDPRRQCASGSGGGDLARRLPAATRRNLVVRPGQPSQLRRVLGHAAGQVDLVLLLGLPRAKLRHPALLHAAASVLRPGGKVVIAVQQRTRPDDDLLSHLVDAAVREGLRYDQHIVALLRPVAALAAASAPRRDGRRDVAHADVLVVTRPEQVRA